MPDERSAFDQALGSVWPENISQGIAIARREIPDLAEIQPYGMVSRALMPDNVAAYVSPGRRIYLNPAVMAHMSPEDVADTLLHEQTHVRQAQQRGHGAFLSALRLMFTPQGAYHERPDEQEAWQAEIDRRSRMGRPQSARPSFVTGRYYIPQDIRLRRESK